ncbi:MAG: hypothetical protein II961_09845 [Candidatus Riflebacteria bacterium]|nr:hypothetical protein [Candidatus Riflebacteria bacterium]
MTFRKLFILLAIIAFTFTCIGCSEDEPVYSLSQGTGYNINLLVSDGEISDAGSFSIQAFVTDPNGDPVPDEDNVVMFACSQNEIKFYDDRCDIKNGFAYTTATWEDQSDDDNPDPSMKATITATYKGAISTAQVTLVSKAF